MADKKMEGSELVPHVHGSEGTINGMFRLLSAEIVAMILELYLRDVGTVGTVGNEDYIPSTNIRNWFKLGSIDKRLRHILREQVRGQITIWNLRDGLREDQLAGVISRADSNFKKYNKVFLALELASKHPAATDAIIAQMKKFLSYYDMTAVLQRGKYNPQRPPLSTACSCACSKLVAILLERADKFDKDRSAAMPMALASEPPLLNRILTARDPWTGNNIFLAAVERPFEPGSYPFDQDAQSEILEMLVTYCKKALGPERVATMINQQLEDDEYTALLEACGHGLERGTRVLLASGGDPMIEDCDGRSALDYALPSTDERRPDVGVVKVLFGHLLTTRNDEGAQSFVEKIKANKDSGVLQRALEQEFGNNFRQLLL